MSRVTTVLDVSAHVGSNAAVSARSDNPDNVWVTIRAPGVDPTLFVDREAACALEDAFRWAALACRYPDCPSAPGSAEDEEMVEIAESVA